ACSDVFKADQGCNVSRISRLYVNPFVRLNHHDPADTLTFARAWIVNDVAFFELPAVDPKENKFTYERIRPQFEGQRTEFATVVRLNLDFVITARNLSDRWRDVQG